MNRIILASHSGLAAGMKQTLQFFGTGDDVAVLEQTAGDSGFEQRADALLSEMQGENCVVFTDIIGGSVNQIFARKLRAYSFHLVTGMNLGTVLECAMTDEPITADFLRQLLKIMEKQTGYMNDRLAAALQSDEDDDD